MAQIFDRSSNAVAGMSPVLTGKLTFAFAMLNLYLAFGQFLTIWSGNHDASRHLHFFFGILPSIALSSFWLPTFCPHLKARPLVQINDPHLTEILEPEHAHA